MSKFINLLHETLGIINEQDPGAMPPMDPSMMAPAPPPAGPTADAEAMDMGGDENEPTNLRESEINLVQLAVRCMLIDPSVLHADASLRSLYNIIIQEVTSQNADEIQRALELIVDSLAPGDVDAESQ